MKNQILYPLSDIGNTSLLNQHKAAWKEVNEKPSYYEGRRELFVQRTS